MGETRNRNSVRVNEEGKEKLLDAKAAIGKCEGKRLTQLELAGRAAVSEKTVKRFFSGKEDVDWESASAIAKALNLELTDLIDIKATTPPLETTAMPIDWRFIQQVEKRFIQQVREHCRRKILNQHSRMRLLSGDEIGVDQLYVDVWLLSRSPHTLQVSPSKFLETFDLRNDRLGLGKRIQRNQGFEVANANEKLLILGKPGAGKTSFLKHLAVDWCKGKFQPDLIVVLIELRRIRDRQWDLLDAIDKELGLENLNLIEELLKEIAELESLQQEQHQKKPNEQIKVLRQQVEKLQHQAITLLKQSKLVVLMDGLDEVPTSELRQDLQDKLRQVVEDYPHNRFILTCRTQIFKWIPAEFTLVEVADFKPEQVKQFVKNWFMASGKSNAEAAEQWEIFKHAVDKNPEMEELTATPVLLSLMCLILQDEGEMPSNKAWVYEKGIGLLLSKWNSTKEINKWEVGSKTYRKLSIEEKETLLTEIAARKFENPKNFVLFEQKEIADQITKFLRLANSSEGVEVLKAIEAQHGLLIERADELWSFSHLTFQEHFTVRWLTQLSSEELAEKIANQQWQEVVKQLVKSQQPADRLLGLIKQAIEQSFKDELKLQDFLAWVQQKSNSIQLHRNEVDAVRAFYFVFDDALPLSVGSDNFLYLALRLDHALPIALELDHALNRALKRTINFAFYPEHIHTRERIHSYDYNSTPDLDLALKCANTLDPELASKLEKLKKEIPEISVKSKSYFQEWRQAHGERWIEQLCQVMIDYRNIGHDWKFTNKQKQQHQRYYDLNKFLIDLIKIPGAVSNTMNTKIKNTLLLPWKEL
ncbi:NACHT C-terminal helical domain 2-containing protein [Nostoc sp.]|uniref:NACHT C-terminal helical domain 2-containing protein n=1 Tax=Nostoc sp. TaxID=1180 RepID=UPI002FF5BB69